MDYGITEQEFWNMTISELGRAIESKKRVQLHEARERAAADYVLAKLIAMNVARIYSSSAQVPAIEEVYPELFNLEDIKEQQQRRRDELSAIRFRQFVDSFNSRRQTNE